MLKAQGFSISPVNVFPGDPGACPMSMTIDELVDNFDLFDEWEEKYRYIIDLGKKLPEMPEAEKVEDNKVRGCMSQVWLTCHRDPADESLLRFNADSDAFIVRGLIAVLMIIYDGKPAAEIAALDALPVLGEIGLDNHLSRNRRNGLVAMVEKIRRTAGTVANAQAG